MKGHKGHGKRSSKRGYVGYTLPKSDPPVPPLIAAIKQARNLRRIVDALPDEETNNLAMDLYKRLGEINE